MTSDNRPGLREVFLELLESPTEEKIVAAKILLREFHKPDILILMHEILDMYEKASESKKKENAPVLAGAFDETVELFSNMKEAAASGDIGFFVSLTGKSAKEISKLPEVAKKEVLGLFVSALSLLNKTESSENETE